MSISDILGRIWDGLGVIKDFACEVLYKVTGFRLGMAAISLGTTAAFMNVGAGWIGNGIEYMNKVQNSFQSAVNFVNGGDMSGMAAGAGGIWYYVTVFNYIFPVSECLSMIYLWFTVWVAMAMLRWWRGWAEKIFNYAAKTGAIVG